MIKRRSARLIGKRTLSKSSLSTEKLNFFQAVSKAILTHVNNPDLPEEIINSTETNDMTKTEFGLNNNIEQIIANLDESIEGDEIAESRSQLTEFMKNAITMQNFNFWCSIREVTSVHAYEWNIANYSIKELLQEPIKMNFSLNEPNWILTLEHGELIIENTNDSPKSCVSGQFKIMGKDKYLSINFHHNFEDNKTLFVRDFIKSQHFNKFKKEFLQNDTLTILCSFQELVMLTTKSGQKLSKRYFEKTCPSAFLALQFETPMYYDVEFSVSGAKFTAHKAIIKLRCPRFWEEVKSHIKNVSEGNIILIEISWITSTIFRELLRFIYTGEVKQESTVVFLVQLANQYEIPSLKAKCEDFLIKTLNLNNAINLFMTAYTLKIPKLIIKADHLIRENLHFFKEEEITAKYFPYMNLIEKEDTLQVQQSSDDYKVAQETHQWIFHDLNSEVKFSNRLVINVLVANNSLDFSFIKDKLGNVSLNVIPKSMNNVKWMNIEIAVANEKDEFIYLKHRGTNNFNSDSTGLRFDEIVKSDYFKHKENSFIVYSYVWLLMKNNLDSKDKEMENNEHCCEKEHDICNDLRRLYEDITDSDVIIRSEKQVLKAHRSLLGPRSMVFNDLFLDHRLKNIKNSPIEINIDLPLKVIKEILRFIYTGKVHYIYDIALDLLKCSLYLKLDSSFKNLSEDALSDMITTENVLNMINASDTYEGHRLKQNCLNFLRKNSQYNPNWMMKMDSSSFGTIKFETLQEISKIVQIQKNSSSVE